MWDEWQLNPVTRKFKEAVENRLEDTKDELTARLNDRDADMFLKGMVQGYSEILEVEYEV